MQVLGREGEPAETDDDQEVGADRVASHELRPADPLVDDLAPVVGLRLGRPAGVLISDPPSDYRCRFRPGDVAFVASSSTRSHASTNGCAKAALNPRCGLVITRSRGVVGVR